MTLKCQREAVENSSSFFGVFWVFFAFDRHRSRSSRSRSSPFLFLFALFQHTTASFFSFVSKRTRTLLSFFSCSHGMSCVEAPRLLAARAHERQERERGSAAERPFVLSFLFRRRRRRRRRKRQSSSIGPPPLTCFPVSPSLSLYSFQALPGQVTPEGVPSFKLVLVGDGGTGKWKRREGR